MSSIKKQKDNEIKEFVLRNYFNDGAQERYVKEAAVKSAQDQKDMLKRYNKIIKSTYVRGIS